MAEATDQDADADRRAWHLAAAAAGSDEQVAEELERSAVRAQARGGLTAAAALLQRAVVLTGDSGRRVERALSAGEASLQAGAFDMAHTLLATAEGGPLDEFQQARVELLRGQLALLSTFGSDAVRLLLKAARRLEPLDAELARDTYLDAWVAALLAGRLSPGGGLLETPEDMAERWANVRRVAETAGRDPEEITLNCCLSIEISDEAVEQEPALLRGTPDQVAERLEAFREVGVRHCGLPFLVGRYPAQMRRFSEAILEPGLLT